MAGVDFWNSATIAAIPLAGVFGGFTAQTFIAGRNVYINSITAERSKWIDKLRYNLAAFRAAIDALRVRRAFLARNKGASSLTDKDIFEITERIDTFSATLQLQLNPSGPIDGNVAALVIGLRRFHAVEGPTLNKVEELLIEHSQWLLKAEWEKVKWEARGWTWRWLHRHDSRNRLADYRKWVASYGAIRPALASLKQAADHPPFDKLPSSDDKNTTGGA